MSEPVKLYGTKQIAEILGASQRWVSAHAAAGRGPAIEFVVPAGRQTQMLWTHRGVAGWLAYHASTMSLPLNLSRFPDYSDHKAVNTINLATVTWKLWWRPMYDGGTQWWFSTPRGWYASTDDGVTWTDMELMTRPYDYRYYCVTDNVNANHNSAPARVLRQALKLRRSLEKETA